TRCGAPRGRREDARRRDDQGRRERSPGRTRGPARCQAVGARAVERSCARDGADPQADVGRVLGRVELGREGELSLGATGASAAAGARQPRRDHVERRGDRGLAAVGRLRRCEADAVAARRLRERGERRARPRHPFPGDFAAPDHRRHEPRPRRGRRLRERQGDHDRAVPGPVRKAARTSPGRRAPGYHPDRCSLPIVGRVGAAGGCRDPAAGYAVMSDVVAGLRVAREQFLALVADVRPELHRYCARMTGSIADGEDVVQDTLARAYYALPELDPLPPLRPWLFRIAHNRAIDHNRRYDRRMREPLDDGALLDAAPAPGPPDTLARGEAVRAAVSLFLELPPTQRSCVILKDVLGHSLDEIAAILVTTVPAVKAALHRGRVRLAELRSTEVPNARA